MDAIMDNSTNSLPFLCKKFYRQARVVICDFIYLPHAPGVQTSKKLWLAVNRSNPFVDSA